MRARGLTVVTTDDVGRKSSGDADQLRYAIENGLAIVSMDRVDFEVLAKEYFEAKRTHCGIFLVGDNSPQVIAQKLNDFLDFNTADEMMNQVVYI
ncbi:MAG: DUF5615 family PIN-like protein [Pyrinomonadaceae bacterium]